MLDSILYIMYICVIYNIYIILTGVEVTMSQKVKAVPFFNKRWVTLIGLFLLSQLIFYIFTVIDWHPRYKDITNELLLKFMSSDFFNQWFGFYEVPHFNLITMFFIIFCLIPGLFGCIRNIFQK